MTLTISRCPNLDGTMFKRRTASCDQVKKKQHGKKIEKLELSVPRHPRLGSEKTSHFSLAEITHAGVRQMVSVSSSCLELAGNEQYRSVEAASARSEPRGEENTRLQCVCGRSGTPRDE